MTEIMVGGISFEWRPDLRRQVWNSYLQEWVTPPGIIKAIYPDGFNVIWESGPWILEDKGAWPALIEIAENERAKWMLARLIEDSIQVVVV